MNKIYNTQAIVLKQKDWRENDRLFTFYSKDFGKIQAIGVGMNKIKSKLAGHLATPGIVDLMIIKGKNFDKIASAFLRKSFQLDMEKDYNYLSLVNEVLNKAFDFGQKDLAVWEKATQTLFFLSKKVNIENKQILILSFIFNLMKEVGYKPKIKKCFFCEKKTNLLNFSLLENSVYCDECKSSKSLKISKNFLEFVNFIYSEKKNNDCYIKKRVIVESFNFVKIWLPYVLEQKINSLEIRFD